MHKPLQGATEARAKTRADSGTEAGFSLVEVLAALAIAALSLVMALQVMTQSARATSRISHETAARDLTRRLFAEEARGAGHAGALDWSATVEPLGPALQRRALMIRWAGGGQLAAARLEMR